MIAPVYTLTINQLLDRRNDLVISKDDIKGLAKNERNKAIDNFVEKAEEVLGSEDYDIYSKKSIREIADLLRV